MRENQDRIPTNHRPRKLRPVLSDISGIVLFVAALVFCWLSFASTAAWGSAGGTPGNAKSEGFQRLGVELIGTFDSLGKRRALISIGGIDEELLVGEGDLLSGFTLETIGEGQMTLVQGEQREVVLMKDLRLLRADVTAKTYTQVYEGPNSFYPIIKTPTPRPIQVVQRPAAPVESAKTTESKVVASTTRPRFSPPIRTGNVSSPFGRRTRPWTRGGYGSTYHEGVDVAAPQGTRIYAAADGKVVDVSKYSRGHRGRYITVRHSGGFETRYYHLYRVYSGLGDSVKAGQCIGLVGNTGRSTGPHLHFEVRQNGVARDPAHYIRSLRR